MNKPQANRSRSAFTLVELVVVIMILGILAGVAAPKLLSTSQTANEGALRQTLAVVRDAIEMYAAQNGGSPPADPSTDLTNYLRGSFPVCPVGNLDATVGTSAANPLAVTGTESWLYNATTGEFICNSSATDGDGDAYSTY